MKRCRVPRSRTLKLEGKLALSLDLMPWERELLLPILLAAVKEIFPHAQKTNAT